jgi:7-cyano-7-deazaguanine synthase
MKDSHTTKMYQPKALVVLSGGQDSTTCLFWAIREFGGAQNVRAVTFDYGQRHDIEINAASMIAALGGLRDEHHETAIVGPILRGTSPLTDPTQPLEQYESYEQMDRVIGNRVEKTFVPMRNALFLTLAANRAVVQGCTTIVTGVCQQDNANYPDCREVFIEAQEHMTNLALGNSGHIVNKTGQGWIYIRTPLMDMTKAQSINLALSIPGAYSALAYSHTAYDGSFPPTGRDHATMLRAQGFLEAGVPDPLILRCWKTGQMAKPDTPNYGAPQVDGAMQVIRDELNGSPLSTISEKWWR